MPYGIVYLPKSPFREALVDYSMQLDNPDNVIMRLGQQALPHLTLAHVEGSDEALRDWWREASTRTLDIITIKLAGLMTSPIPAGDLYVPEGGIYVGIEALRRPNLDAVHHEVLSAAYAMGLSPMGATGHDFRPHITLGVLRELPLTIDSLPANLLTGSSEFHLAFGQIGPYGTLLQSICPRG